MFSPLFMSCCYKTHIISIIKIEWGLGRNWVVCCQSQQMSWVHLSSDKVCSVFHWASNLLTKEIIESQSFSTKLWHLTDDTHSCRLYILSLEYTTTTVHPEVWVWAWWKMKQDIENQGLELFALCSCNMRRCSISHTGSSSKLLLYCCKNTVYFFFFFFIIFYKHIILSDWNKNLFIITSWILPLWIKLYQKIQKKCFWTTNRKWS